MPPSQLENYKVLIYSGQNDIILGLNDAELSSHALLNGMCSHATWTDTCTPSYLTLRPHPHRGQSPHHSLERTTEVLGWPAKSTSHPAPSYTRTHMHTQYINTHARLQTRTCTVSHSHSLALTHSHSLALTHSHLHSLTLTRTTHTNLHSLTDTHTHSHWLALEITTYLHSRTVHTTAPHLLTFTRDSPPSHPPPRASRPSVW